MKSIFRCVALGLLLVTGGCTGGNRTDSGNSGGTDSKPPLVKDPLVEDSSGTNTDDDSSAGGTTVDGSLRDPMEGDPRVANLTIAELIETLPDPELAAPATEELYRRGDEAVKPLTAALEHEDAAVQHRAIFLLGRYGDVASDALPKLRDIAKNSDSEIARDAANFAIDAIEGNDPAAPKQ